jgi:hypothetical protein
MNSAYDPQPDLDKLRLTAGARYAPACVALAALFELSVYLSAATSVATDSLAIRALIHGKALVILAAGFAVHRATRLDALSRTLVPAIAAVLLVTSAVYLATTILMFGGITSCFSFFVPSVSFFALLTSPPFRAAALEAAAARARLEAEGMDGF